MNEVTELELVLASNEVSMLNQKKRNAFLIRGHYDDLKRKAEENLCEVYKARLKAEARGDAAELQEVNAEHRAAKDVLMTAEKNHSDAVAEHVKAEEAHLNAKDVYAKLQSDFNAYKADILSKAKSAN